MANKNKQTPLFDIDECLSWKKEWVGMPEFIQEELAPFKSIIVKFQTKEARDDFAKLIGQKLTDKTISIWYPKVERENLLIKKCIDEESKTTR